MTDDNNQAGWEDGREYLALRTRAMPEEIAAAASEAMFPVERTDDPVLPTEVRMGTFNWKVLVSSLKRRIEGREDGGVIVERRDDVIIGDQ